LITHWKTIPYAGLTFLGVISLIATVAATFYTTASEAMVTPKIKFGDWEKTVLEGRIKFTYANPLAVSKSCTTPLRDMDPAEAGGACLNVQYSGQCEFLPTSRQTIWADRLEQRTETSSHSSTRGMISRSTARAWKRS
jgi:hypothetical protein